jgi:hypothetical protein
MKLLERLKLHPEDDLIEGRVFKFGKHVRHRGKG